MTLDIHKIQHDKWLTKIFVPVLQELKEYINFCCCFVFVFNLFYYHLKRKNTASKKRKRKKKICYGVSRYTVTRYAFYKQLSESL